MSERIEHRIHLDDNEYSSLVLDIPQAVSQQVFRTGSVIQKVSDRLIEHGILQLDRTGSATQARFLVSMFEGPAATPHITAALALISVADMTARSLSMGSEYVSTRFGAQQEDGLLPTTIAILRPQCYTAHSQDIERQAKNAMYRVALDCDFAGERKQLGWHHDVVLRPNDNFLAITMDSDVVGMVGATTGSTTRFAERSNGKILVQPERISRPQEQLMVYAGVIGVTQASLSN